MAAEVFGRCTSCKSATGSVRRNPCGVSRGAAMRLIADGLVQVDGRVGKKGVSLLAGQTAALPEDAQDDVSTPPVAEPICRLWFCTKTPTWWWWPNPQGQACHPLRGGERGTVANAVVAVFRRARRQRSPSAKAGLSSARRGHKWRTAVCQTPAAWTKLRADFAGGLVERIPRAGGRRVPMTMSSM